MRRWLSALAVLVTTAAGVAAGGAAAGAIPARHLQRPWVKNGHTVPIYPYKNAVHESVWIQTSIDSDDDGTPDRVALDIIRPAGAAMHHLKVPVILEASPYYLCCGRGNESETKTYDDNGVIAKMPLFYDNFFVPRGYAMAQLDLPGTGRSTGRPDAGGPDQIAGVTAAINWLNGTGSAVDGTGHPVSAMSWTNGRVGMIGKSWDGSVANGAAATGVHGLKTVVAISSISSWYDYTRADGVLRGRNYVRYLDEAVSGRPRKVCRHQFADEQAASDDTTADFNSYWRASDYRTHAARVKASVFVVHGLHDDNVIPNQFSSWWRDLARHGVARTLWLSQTGHVDPFDYRRSRWVHTLHTWFDHWLQGLHNGVMAQPQVSVERPSGGWTTEPSWPDNSGHTTVSFGAPSSAARTIVDHPKLHERQMIAHPGRHRAGRAVFLGAEHAAAQHLSGVPSVRLRIKLNRPTSEISARLVQYGSTHRVDYDSTGLGISTLNSHSCWGQSTKTDDACYRNTALDYVTSGTDVLSRGWLDAAHRNSLRHPSDLTPGKWYTIVVPMTPTDTVVPPDHQLGVVVTLSDNDFTDPSKTGATAVVDPAHSSIRLPVQTKGRA